MAANVGWKGRMIAPATMTAPASSRTNRVRRSRRASEQHTGGDRVHAAGNGEEPTIQFSTDFLIRLQQHPGRRRHEHYGHHKEEAGECGNHPEDDHPYTVSSTERVRDGTLRGSGAHSHVGLSETSTSEAAGVHHLENPGTLPW